jgi:class 3 adenylate cyclase/tetratricopeptide (TPR) repeat protein
MGELETLQQAIAALEAQRHNLGDAVVDAALGPMQEKLAALQTAGQPEQQRKLATILFMDIAGHTAMTHNLDPEELIEVIDRPLARMAEEVTRHGGRVVRFQGDGFKTVFGLPTADEDDPENAVRAGLAIQEKAREIADELERERDLNGFAVRVGIATGLVLGGGGTEGEDSVKGETVNLAARMESAAQPGTVLIAHSTYQLVRGVFDLQPLEPVRVKGFDEPVQVYRVLAAKPRSFRTRRRGVEGVETRMVGRDREYKRLQELFSAMLDGSKGQFVTIVGEPGLGKSRLLYEFENWVDLRPERVQLYRGRARLETRRLPYGLLRDLFATRFDIHDSDSEATAIQKLEGGIAEIIGSGHEDWAHFIGYLIGFNYTHSPHLVGILDDAQQIRDRAFTISIQFFKTILRKQPVLLLLEDIHWADSGSLDFFDQLAVECSDLPMMVICLARNTLFEGRPGWGKGQPAHVRLDLSPLSEQDSQELVVNILRKVPEIPPRIHNLIVQRAEGNPFYVEEVIKMLIDDGVIIPDPERWQVKQEKFVEGKIPQTLTGVLQARLDGLPKQELLVLHRASVAGRVFWDDLTANMQDSALRQPTDQAAETVGALSKLQGRELIFCKEPSAFSGTTEFMFKHAVLRDVTYESLLKQIRRTYHKQVADWLREHSGERVGEYAGRIGEHYDRAGESTAAAEWYARAGKQAQDTYAPDVARDYYQKALMLWGRMGNLTEVQRFLRIEVYSGLGQVLNWLGLYGEATEAYQRMASAAETEGDTVMQARAWHGIAEAQMHRGDIRAAIESATQEESLAREALAQLELTKALWLKAWGAFRLGNIERAHTLAEQVSIYSRSLQDRGQMAHSLNLLGVLESVSGRFQEATQYFEQALKIFRSIGNRRRAMPLMNNLGVIAEARGDYHGAMLSYQEALETAREIGNRDGEMVYLTNLGGIRVRIGEYIEAEADLLQVIQMAGSGGLDVLSSTYSYLAQANLGQDRLAEALTAAQRALALAEEMESQEDLGIAWRALGRVAAAFSGPVPVEETGGGQPRTADAEACFIESESIFKKIEREEERARTLREMAIYKLEQGDQQNGMRLWAEARAIFTQLGAQLEVDRMEEIHAKQGDIHAH